MVRRNQVIAIRCHGFHRRIDGPKSNPAMSEGASSKTVSTRISTSAASYFPNTASLRNNISAEQIVAESSLTNQLLDSSAAATSSGEPSWSSASGSSGPANPPAAMT